MVGLFLIAALIAGILVAGTKVGGDGDTDREIRSLTRVTAPARDWDAECDNDGDSRSANPAELPPQLLYFPSYVPSGLSLWSTGGSIWPDHLGCHHGDIALVLTESDRTPKDQVGRTIEVSGPSYRVRRPANPGGREAERTVTVRGGTGVWRTWGDSFGRLFWADPEGGEWTLNGARDLDEAIAVAEGLRIDLDIDGPPVVADDLPDGFEVLWERPEQEGAGYSEDTGWALSFEGPGGPQPPSYSPPPPSSGQPGEPAEPVYPPYSGPAVSIGFGRMSTPSTIFAHASGEPRLTEVRGHRALEHVNPDGSGSISWDEEYGITVRVSGSVGLAELRKVAESLEPIRPDDSRLAEIARPSP